MTRADFVNGVTRTFHKVGFTLKKHSPEILVVAGVVGTVASTVLACKATTKLHSIVDETKEKIEMFNQGAEDGKVQSEVDGQVQVVEYTKEDCARDTAITYTQTGIKIAKLYAPAVAVGVISITSILAGHNILRKRNIALAAAFTTVDTGFKEYRSRVVERFGKELDRELKFNIKNKEVEETIVNEDGSEQTVTKTVEVASVSEVSDYARFFDETCTLWSKDPEYNLMVLKQQENYANILLKERGHLYLNEVYKMLGMQQTKAGQVVGWIYDGDHGDSYVSFGIYDVHNEQKRAFVNGYERSILLDFNVDGNIWELMQ